jgi:hypothetical protein
MYRVQENKDLTRIDISSSSLTSLRAPMSSQVTFGMVANPSLIADGCTCFRAS